MPRFQCNNEKCEKHITPELIPHVRFTWNEDTHTFDSEYDICPMCGSTRNVMKEKEEKISMPWFKAENARNYENKAPVSNPRKFNY